MDYSNARVRRQDRLLDEPAARQLLQTGEFGVLSMQADGGGGYGVPLNFAWDGQRSLYVHCAPEGRKLRCLDAETRVSFCVVGATRVVSAKFTTGYESIVLACTAHRHLPPEERLRALELILDKYSPADKAAGLKYARHSFPRTEIVRLDVVSWSGKNKRVGLAP